MVSFSDDLDAFSLRLRVEAAPRVPRARRLMVEVGSGTVALLSGVNSAFLKTHAILGILPQNPQIK
jgi:hypothetical protein